MGRKSLGIAVPLLATLALAGCGNDDEPKPQAPAPAPQVEQVSDQARKTTPLSAVRTATVILPMGPDWLAADGDQVYVKRDNGLVSRVDADTGKVTGEVRAGSDDQDQLCQGIGVGGGAVWSCAGADIVRIDPKRMRVTDKLKVGKVYDQGHLVYAADRIWVLTGEGDRLTGIDPATNRTDDPIRLPAKCSELGAGGEPLWLACPLANRVLRVDVGQRKVTDVLRVANPTTVSGGPAGVWVGSDEGMVRFDPATMKRTTVIADLKPGFEGEPYVDGDTVWVRTALDFLHRIDARTGAVLERIAPKAELSGGSVMVHQGAVWTTAYDDGTLLRLEAG